MRRSGYVWIWLEPGPSLSVMDLFGDFDVAIPESEA